MISKEYEKKSWAQLERRASQARELAIGNPGFLIPVLVDNFLPDWLLPTRIFFDLTSRSIEILVSLLIKKVNQNGLGKYVRRVEMEIPFDAGCVQVAALMNEPGFAIWSTAKIKPPMLIHFVTKIQTSGKWTISESKMRTSERHAVFPNKHTLILAEDESDKVKIIRDDGKFIDVISIPRQGKWDFVSVLRFNGQQILAGYLGGDVWMVDIATKEPIRVCEGMDDTGDSHVAFGPKDLALIQSNGKIYLYSLPDKRIVNTFTPQDGGQMIAWPGKLDRFALTCERFLYTIDFRSWEKLYTEIAPNQYIAEVAAANLSGLVGFIAGMPWGSNVLGLYDISSGLLIGSCVDDDRPWESLAFSCDDNAVAAVLGSELVIFDMCD